MKLAAKLFAATAVFAVLAAPAPAQTPKDPKSPVAGFPDGRGPSGPVSMKIVAPKADEVVPIPPAEAGQPAATGAPVEVKIELTGYETFQDPASKKGQYVALMLDNIPTVFAYYDVSKPWVFKRIPKKSTATDDTPLTAPHTAKPRLVVARMCKNAPMPDNATSSSLTNIVAW